MVARAEGDAARFTQLVTEYKKAPEVTRERLYLETMETVMSGSRKVLVDSANSNNMLYIPVDPKSATVDLPTAAIASAATVSTDSSTPTTSNAGGNTDMRQQRPLSPGQTRESRQ